MIFMEESVLSLKKKATQYNTHFPTFKLPTSSKHVFD